MAIKQTLIAASLGLLFAGNALASAPAGITNGNFSNGLTGWTAEGDVAKSFGSVVLTTASVDFEDDFPEAAGTFNASGNTPIDFAWVDPAAMATSLGFDVSGLDQSELEAAAAAVFEGSFLMQSFSYSAGQTLSFDWNFSTNEPQDGSGMPDFAFVVIDGVASELASAADATTASLPFAWSTGKQHFSHTFTTTGSGTLAFGVVDIGDYSNTSALVIDNVAVVPEPETYALMLAGLGLVGMMARRRKA